MFLRGDFRKGQINDFITMVDVSLFQTFLKPKSVAIVGASADPKKTGSRAQRFLLSHGYKGKVFPVNPNRKEIFGLKCYPSLKSINEQVDHIFVAVDGNKIIEAVKDAILIKVRCASILSGGFSEAGSEGNYLEKSIFKIAQKGDLRILGPNSIGLINISDNVVFSANAMLELKVLKKGSLSVISHSGSLIGALLAHGHSRGIGFSKLISVGNESDLSVGEIGKMLVNDPNTETIILFLETLRNSNEVAEMSRMAHAAGKQIICYKLGKSELGKELAKSHTGAIAGNDDAFNAFINYHGIARVEIFETLIEIPNLFRKKKKSESKRVGIVTTTGGGGAMVVENLSGSDIEIVDPGLPIQKIMQDNNIPYNNNKLVDLTIAGTKPEIVTEVISQMMQNKNCDIVVMVVGSSAKFRPEQAVEPLLKWANYKKPLAVYVAPDAPEALILLQQNNIACFRTPESCAESVKTFLNTKNPVKTKILKNDLSKISNKLKKNISKNLSEEESLEIFKEIGIEIVNYKVSVNEKQAIVHSSQIGFPLAMKVLSNQILHKTETGGVELNIQNLEELKISFKKLSDVFNKLKINSSDKKFLIQKMEKGISEIILGYRVDELVGPIVVIGSGGILSEIYDDKSIRIAPVDITEAKKMIKEVKSLVTITGYRGLPQANINTIATAIVKMSKLAFVKEIKEAEINPVIVKNDNEGIVAVDGLITLN